ncbi:hypothetical protein WJX84_004735 [Apatococcus fuscideae]|uniref:Uncharacterized protein n=1 Tax=Apatococcus fuscideae TaxID=2026836 RepID=A0AAW1T451_9CHLO
MAESCSSRRGYEQDAALSEVRIPAPEPCPKVKQEGRKIVPSPRRTNPPPAGIKMFPAVRAHQAGHLPEPDVGRMGRGEARASNAPSAKERSLEQSLHRKVRVNPECYQGSGRAGDLSDIHKQPADCLEGFRPRKADAPGFRRFMDSLAPSPQNGPHEHRAQAEAAAAASQTATASQGIQQLEAWDTQHVNTAAEEAQRGQERAAMLAQARKSAAANAALAAKSNPASARGAAAGKPTKK